MLCALKFERTHADPEGQEEGQVADADEVHPRKLQLALPGGPVPPARRPVVRRLHGLDVVLEQLHQLLEVHALRRHAAVDPAVKTRNNKSSIQWFDIETCVEFAQHIEAHARHHHAASHPADHDWRSPALLESSTACTRWG